jgi:hypothetical protein
MIANVIPKVFKELQPNDPHPFVSESFVQVNKEKAERIVRLVDPENNSLGLVAGVSKQELKSPFSAPFGGFHYRHEKLYISEVSSFITGLIDFVKSEDLKSIHITLPPDIYHATLNAKVNSVLMRSAFTRNIPEITNWVDLREFENRFTFRSSREYYNQAVKHGLTFQAEDSAEQQAEIYTIIKENRQRLGRSIFMTLHDLKKIEALWPVDFFSVMTPEKEIVAGAIFYRCHPEIIQAVFWGDSEAGRPLRAMDFLLFNLWSHYKQANFRYIDLGISTESGIPNEGLLRFKETHECASCLRYSYTLNL